MPQNALLASLDGSAFGFALRSRLPWFVNGVFYALCSLLTAALAWLGLTEADQVIRAPGHVRSASLPLPVCVDYREDTNAVPASVRVAEVHYQQGDRVTKGQVLIRLNTRRLEDRIEETRIA